MTRKKDSSISQINLTLFRIFSGSDLSIHNSFPFNPGIVPEIHQQSELKPYRMKIIDNLRPMFIDKLGYSFDFHNDFITGFSSSLFTVIES